MLDNLFETSWEVCNKVGGIYAVLSTKAQTLHDLFGERLVFIGPDLWTAENPSPSFTEDHSLYSRFITGSLPMGITARVGRWDVPSKPIAILVGFQHLIGQLDAMYGMMWEKFGVDSLHGYGDYDEACAFAVAAAMVIEHIIDTRNNGQTNTIAHFDEWTTGMGLLLLKSRQPDVRTVFTTHATTIGRSIAGNGKPLYDYLVGYDGTQMAAELNVSAKHSLEHAAAHAADAFTTVSEVTARECEQLLQRRPIVTPNAFEPTLVPAPRTLAARRRAARAKLSRVVEALTGHPLDADTLLVATSGRCEMRNKGIDLYIDALNVARTRLDQAEDIHRRVVAFVLVPCWTDVPRPELLQAIKEGSADGLPQPYLTHRLFKPEHDAILNKMAATEFTGQHSDSRLTLIDIPCYLSPDDGLLNLPYFDVLAAMDLTVFPSYYEPWGYTPLESVAFHVPTITTDLAGFGQWVLDNRGDDPDKTGVTIVHRSDSNYHEAVHKIAEHILEALTLTPERTRKRRAQAAHTAAMATWEQFIQPYLKAYNQQENNSTTQYK